MSPSGHCAAPAPGTRTPNRHTCPTTPGAPGSARSFTARGSIHKSADAKCSRRKCASRSSWDL
eukprot:14440369-Alexandrium_andersonii.AAC.1